MFSLCTTFAALQVNIVGLSDQQVASVDSLLGLITYGNSVRSTGSTGANSDSSRSHAVLQICLKDKKSEQIKGELLMDGGVG